MNITRLLFGGVMLFVVGTALQLAWPLVQAASYHHFADERSLGFIPNAADVLSNVVILAGGFACLGWVKRNASRQPPQFPGMAVAGFGLVLTAIGSAYYHWAPSDATLVWDRLPMTIVFAGILAMLWTSTTAQRVGWLPLLILVAVSLGTIEYWLAFNSLWPYAILQFGGLAFIVGLTLTRKVDSVFGWMMVIVFYGVAKIFESLDWQVWELSHHVIAGHALKHVSSGLAGAALILVANAAPRFVAGMPTPRPTRIDHSSPSR
ncbi:MAG TPA: hypothetical protein VMJ11_20585 [Paraburkholderia sp.]|uniref:hypothetical protein n=1 Tax=Paraburkholderia sp. TaxID=1926495 RepID=UPI002BC36E7A|nr:hypothetical protein [Paraburkholderia sp.]HTR09000.1 hypothetical protein [Paraburkholderia sp.]